MDYRRPSWRTPQYRDQYGAVIDYGHRWGRDSPPDDSYSRQTNPQRFEPVVLVARALVEFLQAEYDISATTEAPGGRS